MKESLRPLVYALLLGYLLLTACERPDPAVTIATVTIPVTLPPQPGVTPRSGGGFMPGSLPTYTGTPTPDPIDSANLSAGGAGLTHVVNPGETLGYIAQLHGTTVEALAKANQLTDSNIIQVGQELQVPGQTAVTSPSLKLIPDSELVYGPLARGFSVREAATAYNSYLLAYSEDVEGQPLAGPEIIELVAQRHSVNPRLLLALLEFRSSWLTQTAVADPPYPLGYANPSATGLYRQLSWAANLLNLGFYGRSEGGLKGLAISDGSRVAFALDINDGTAAVQTVLAAHSGATLATWQQEVGPNGFGATYGRLFGNPFAYTYDPLWPSNLGQPPLRLPWPSGETWYLTSGPHGGWNTGSAWAALDFAPAGDQLGCFSSDAWVTSMSDGVVTRSGFGMVMVDLDGDGYAGTGWAITYMHLETRDRLPAGTPVQSGDRLGHPSCEGGFSDGTHLHITRTFNGRWVAADDAIPFDMSGWVSEGTGVEYDGRLVRGGVAKEACACRSQANELTAD